MEDDVFRLALLALGSCIILAVLAHGIWVSRKNNKQKAERAHAARTKSTQQFQPSGWQDDQWHVNDVDEDENENEGELVNLRSVKDPSFSLDVDDDSLETSHVNRNTTHTPIKDTEFDDLGLGAVRVVGANPLKAKVDKQQKMAAPSVNKVQENSSSDTPFDDELPSLGDFQPSAKISQPEPKPVATGKIYASVVSQPKPEYAARFAAGGVSAVKPQPKVADDYQAPEPPPFLLKKNQTDEDQVAQAPRKDVDIQAINRSGDEPVTKPLSAEQSGLSQHTSVESQHSASGVDLSQEKAEKASLPERFSLAEQARNLVLGKKAEGITRKRREPKIADDQMRIDFDDQHESQHKTTSPSATTKPAGQQSPKPTAGPQTAGPNTAGPQEVLVLNVKAADSAPIQGAALLPMLLTLGFKFGDQDIFHRHVNSNGKGPVLFSLANMFKPGNFDIDNLENFTTQGLSLFMILPIEGDPHQVFNMMHNAARKIADEFSAQVYDGRRALLTKQSLQQYVEKIREFERKRMINR
ncbi:MAG: cell division protein ZipA [Paraglaciecola sp.]|nr:cell division protein ZipA [Paraglaciecola sp.]NCT47994.1 cell division protein ZipA [Paraglaciecola sp.]